MDGQPANKRIIPFNPKPKGDMIFIECTWRKGKIASAFTFLPLETIR